MRRVTLISLVVGMAACASRAPAVIAPNALLAAMDASAKAEAQVLAGCYTCLVEARATYAQLVNGPLADSARPKLFEAAILVTLREKELALPFDASFAQAEAAAKALPASHQANRILDLVNAIPGDSDGWNRTRSAEFRRWHQPYSPRVPDELTWLRTSWLQPHVQTYLALAVACTEMLGARLRTSPTPASDSDASSPLLGFRGASCAGIRSVPRLQSLLRENPAFAEVALFLGRGELSKLSNGGDRAEFERLVTLAGTAFPNSPAVSVLLGRGLQYLGECREALAAYDRTIALEPSHDDAWLGRTVCLSALDETAEAIESATHLVDLGPASHLRDGYYWRAFNRHRLADFAAARADIDAARRHGSSVDILTLAGQIEYEQGSLDEAKRDLLRARQISTRACTAAWYLGLVAIKRQVWVDAGEAFEAAMFCYRESAGTARLELTRLQNTPDLDQEYVARQGAVLRANITDQEQQERYAAMNAAKGFANAGHLDKIDPLIVVASPDAELAEDIAVLRQYVGQRPAVRRAP